MAFDLLAKLSDVERHQWERYTRALHAMQSGVKAHMELSPGGMSADTMPKHMRTGINSAMVETSVLGRVMLAKGIMTREEYFRTLADVMEEEAHRYEALLSEMSGGMKVILDWRSDEEIAAGRQR